METFELHSEMVVKLASPSSPGRDEEGAMENMLGQLMSSLEQLIREHNGVGGIHQLFKGLSQTKQRSGSREESCGTPTSHGSCQSSPVSEGLGFDLSPAKEQPSDPCPRIGASPDLPSTKFAEELNSSSACSVIPNCLLPTKAQETFGGMPVEGTGSSKDIRKPCALSWNIQARSSP